MVAGFYGNILGAGPGNTATNVYGLGYLRDYGEDAHILSSQISPLCSRKGAPDMVELYGGFFEYAHKGTGFDKCDCKYLVCL